MSAMHTGMAVFCIFAATAISGQAAKRITIEQLHQTLDAAQRSHGTDDIVMQQLGGLVLANRLSTPELNQLLSISPGPKTAEALTAIADTSAFLDPPSEEIPATPAPSVAVQKAIMAQVIHYVARTLPTLPNLLATRVTEHYVDSMRGMEPDTSKARASLFLIGTYRTPIAFRDGRETDDPAMAASVAASTKKAGTLRSVTSINPAATNGLSSWGEFGPILQVVLTDAAKGKLSWARWEQIGSKPSAVFQFSIDRTNSHYAVKFCCEASDGPGYNGLRKVEGPPTLRQAGYHGYLTVDPDSGTVLKITIEADLSPEDDVRRASMMVEYGPVKIGDGIHFCPIRSVSVSLARSPVRADTWIEHIDRLSLNDVRFTDYHRFGSESTLIADPSPSPIQTADAAATESTASETPTNRAVNAAAPAASGPEPGESKETGATLTDTSTKPVASQKTVVNPAPDETDEEILVRAVNGLPGFDPAPKDVVGAASAGSNASFTLKVTTRLVDMSLLAFDKHGKPIKDLKQDEIEIYDNGRRQQLRQFHHASAEERPATPPSPVQTQPVNEFSNSVADVQQTEDVPDTLILLMDESHLPFQDLNRARGEVLRFLRAIRPTSRVALYSIGEHGFHVIQDVTQDHALVMTRLAAWMPSASAVTQALELDRRNRQQFDTVRSASDLGSVNGNSVDSPENMHGTDPELRQMGDNPLRQSLEGMIALARHFGPVPGHKSLAWISGDSVLANWEDKAVGKDKGSKQLDPAIAHTREALNEAHIALYAVDASNVSTGAIDSSLYNRNVGVDPSDISNLAPGGAARNSAPGRATAQMQQDLHGIEGPVRSLAESTGGRAINKGSDLALTLRVIEQDSAALYEIGFTPDSQADGTFHTLLVKTPGRNDVKLRYRTGYLYKEEGSTTQERFQLAVWSPQDATGIGLTAEAVPPTDKTEKGVIRLRVAFKGLQFEQKADRWTDQLYIFIAERDDAAQKAQVSGDTLRMSLKQATYDTGMPTGIPFKSAVDVKSKLGSVRVIVVDGNSGRMGSVTLPASTLYP